MPIVCSALFSGIKWVNADNLACVTNLRPGWRCTKAECLQQFNARHCFNRTCFCIVQQQRRWWRAEIQRLCASAVYCCSRLFMQIHGRPSTVRIDWLYNASGTIEQRRRQSNLHLLLIIEQWFWWSWAIYLWDVGWKRTPCHRSIFCVWQCVGWRNAVRFSRVY